MPLVRFTLNKCINMILSRDLCVVFREKKYVLSHVHHCHVLLAETFQSAQDTPTFYNHIQTMHSPYDHIFEGEGNKGMFGLRRLQSSLDQPSVRPSVLCGSSELSNYRPTTTTTRLWESEQHQPCWSQRDAVLSQSIKPSEQRSGWSRLRKRFLDQSAGTGWRHFLETELIECSPRWQGPGTLWHYKGLEQ